MNIGSLMATLGIDIGDFKKGTKIVKSEIQGIEKDWKKLGIISSHQFKKMKDDFIQAHNRIKKHASSTDKDILASKRALVNKLNKLNKQYANQTKRTLSKVNKDWTSALRGIGGAVTLYLSADAIYDWTKSIVEAGVRIQSVENAFKAVTGTTKLAREELDFVGKTADDLGLNLMALEDSYKGLAAASINTKLEGEGARDVFYSVAEATSAMQLSATQSHAALYALQQMMSKGRVQTEELRRQLGEQLPGAFQIAAEAMGMSTAKLNKMLEMGKVVSEDFLPKFAKVLHERFGKAAVENAELARGAFNRFGNSVERLKRTLANSGIVDFFADLAKIGTMKIKELTGEVGTNSEEMKVFFEDMGKNFEDTLMNIDVKDITKGLRSIASILSDIKSIYDLLPSYVISAGGVGIIGTILFGGQAGIIIGTVSLLNNTLGELGNSLGGLVDKHYAAGNAIIELWKSVKEAVVGPELTQFQIPEKPPLTFGIGKDTEGYKKYLDSFKRKQKLLPTDDEEGPTLKELQKRNREKYKMTIASAELLDMDMSIIKEEGMKKAILQHQETEMKLTQIAYDDEVKRLELVKEFNDQHAELGKTKFDIERDLLAKEVEIYKQANVDKVKLDEWASAKSKEISKAESEQRISDIHDTVSIMTDGFKDISEMGVKHSKESFLAYQAFKIIEIGIATRSAAMGAYSAMASIPYVGPALGIAAAIAATTFGVAQAAAVASMQPPSYDSGGISSARGIYQTGDISEAHIPIPSGGKIPVEMKNDKKENTPQEVNIANLFDPAMIDEYMASSRGQNAIFNTIGKRPQLLKRMVSR